MGGTDIDLTFVSAPFLLPRRNNASGTCTDYWMFTFKSLKEIPKRYPDIDLALLHLGGTKFFGVMLTMDAKQGVEAIKLINPHEAIPVHYNDYNVFKSPLEDFKHAVTRAGFENRVRYLSHGDTYTFEVPADRR